MIWAIAGRGALAATLADAVIAAVAQETLARHPVRPALSVVLLKQTDRLG